MLSLHLSSSSEEAYRALTHHAAKRMGTPGAKTRRSASVCYALLHSLHFSISCSAPSGADLLVEV